VNVSGFRAARINQSMRRMDLVSFKLIGVRKVTSKPCTICTYHREAVSRTVVSVESSKVDVSVRILSVNTSIASVRNLQWLSEQSLRISAGMFECPEARFYSGNANGSDGIRSVWDDPVFTSGGCVSVGGGTDVQNKARRLSADQCCNVVGS
jgi:hypothetical protein